MEHEEQLAIPVGGRQCACGGFMRRTTVSGLENYICRGCGRLYYNNPVSQTQQPKDAQ
jgi:hypothetical protein